MKIKTQITHTQQQSNRIVMTPQLRRAIEILLMPQLELRQFIEQEMEENPLLEIQEESETEQQIEDFDPAPEWNESEENIDREDTSPDIDWADVFDDMRIPIPKMDSQYVDPDAPEPDIAETLSLHGYLYQQLQLAAFTDTERAIGELIIGNLNDDGQLELKLFALPLKFADDFEQGSLSEELNTTLSERFSDLTRESKTPNPEDKESGFVIHSIAAPPECKGLDGKYRGWQLIDTANKKTYTVKREETELALYQLTLEDIALEIGCPLSQVESVLHTIQYTFEPTGIAYRDLQETLCIQIDTYRTQHFKTNDSSDAPMDSDVPYRLAKNIVEHHFDALLNNRITTIEDALGIDETEIRRAVKWIGTLSPYPGRYFSDPTFRALSTPLGANQIVIPDVQILKINGDYQIVQNNDHIPRLRINPYYVDLMHNQNETLDAETKAWIQKRYSKASDLLSNITQRGNTIVRITQAIFEVQSDFLTEGPDNIKPLTLKTIAMMAGVHESTVSRVTRNKYVQTPHGIFPLKFFFSNQLNTTQGDTVSTARVKSEIKEIIGNEDPAKPLSDEAVSMSLKDRGFVVARRTVQKYRDELGIHSSRQRKRLSSLST